MDYTPRDIEIKWQKHWSENRTYEVSHQSDKPKFYVLDMFPYPSGAGLHVGHPLGYIASDIFARYKRLKGFNVLHPMGFDAFGLPAEQYAIQTGVHPAKSTDENIARYRKQLNNLGFSFDWSREVRTSNPDYYKWTQWIFLQLFNHWYDENLKKARPIPELINAFERGGSADVKASCSERISFSSDEWASKTAKERSDILMNFRLAYKKVTFVWWCEDLGTVLANDEVKDGVSERGGFPVERKPMLQWSLRITAYAERLLEDLAEVQFSESMKKMQSNWIGKSQGAQMFFDLVGHDEKVEIFTTRPDTIFGATFMVLAPEHDLVKKITTGEQKENIENYLNHVNTRSERDRMAETKEVSGEFTGAYALNPFTGEKIPVWIAEYVLKDYGTGAIMAVPADDERDFRFAKKFGIPVVEIIDKSDYPGAEMEDKTGKMINSGFLNGMEVRDAIEAVINEVENRGIGERKVNYKLRDAIYSRQRYWGEPFPIVYDEDNVAHTVPENELPVELPELEDFKPTSGAKSPLARATDWVNLPNGWRRETDTMPGFAGSSWYFLRYMDPHNDERFAGEEAVNYWRDVDLYVGGTEHAVGHLMYSRFWHKFLYDLGKVPTKEPFKKLINQGMIQGVIESLFQKKEKEGDRLVIVSRNLAENDPGSEYIKIPIPIEFVKDYGLDRPYIDEEGIEKFMAWRPEYQHALFRSGSGEYADKTFTPTEEGSKMNIGTFSEVGKMSKSKYNVINPDDVVNQYGADTFRMYEMFLGPVEQSKPWDTKGITGVYSFLRKTWELFFDENDNWNISEEKPGKEELKILHTAIKRVTEDIERFSFNTCVAHFMICVNELRRLKCNKKEILEQLTVLLAPFAPHIAEECWQRLGYEGSVHHSNYPVANEEHLKEDTISYPVSINGKKRAMVDFPADVSKDFLEKAALEVEAIQKYLEEGTVRKVIVVPGRMINIVVS